MPAVRKSFNLYVLLFAFLAWLVCFHRLGAVGIFDLDEGLYSTASRQMLESGNYVVPYIGSDVRFAKPPLIYWVQAPSMAVFGFTPFAVRFPSALCILATALLLWHFAARRGRPRAGWLAGLIFLSCPASLVLARQGIIDALLTLCLTVLVFGWCQVAEASDNLHRRRGWYLVAVGMGLSVLAKGLLGVVIPIACLVFWFGLERKSYPWRGMPWGTMLLIFIAIALPWHVLMYQKTGFEFIEKYFLSNHFKRFAGQEHGHAQPIWFYIPVLLVAMFPWSTLLPLAWWQSFAEKSNEDKLNLRIWALWAAAIFIFFSVSKSKLFGYILPALPPLALLIGVRVDDLWRSKTAPKKFESAFLLALPLLLGLIAVAAGLLGQSWRGQNPVMLFGKKMTASTVETGILLSPWLVVLGGVFVVSALLAFAFRSNAKRLVLCQSAITCALTIVVMYGGLTNFDREQIQPFHDLARETLPGLEHGETVVAYNLKPRRPSMRFVLGHTGQVSEIEKGTPEDLRQAIGKSNSGYILTMDNVPLPDLGNRIQINKLATSRKWVLYHWGRNPS